MHNGWEVCRWSQFAARYEDERGNHRQVQSEGEDKKEYEKRIAAKLGSTGTLCSAGDQRCNQQERGGQEKQSGDTLDGFGIHTLQEVCDPLEASDGGHESGGGENRESGDREADPADDGDEKSFPLRKVRGFTHLAEEKDDAKAECDGAHPGGHGRELLPVLIETHHREGGNGCLCGAGGHNHGVDCYQGEQKKQSESDLRNGAKWNLELLLALFWPGRRFIGKHGPQKRLAGVPDAPHAASEKKRDDITEFCGALRDGSPICFVEMQLAVFFRVLLVLKVNFDALDDLFFPARAGGPEFHCGHARTAAGDASAKAICHF